MKNWKIQKPIDFFFSALALPISSASFHFAFLNASTGQPTLTFSRPFYAWRLHNTVDDNTLHSAGYSESRFVRCEVFAAIAMSSFLFYATDMTTFVFR